MKPKTKDEAHLHRKFKLEDEIPYELERTMRENKRVWKRQTSKLHRKIGKQEIEKQLKGDNNE